MQNFQYLPSFPSQEFWGKTYLKSIPFPDSTGGFDFRSHSSSPVYLKTPYNGETLYAANYFECNLKSSTIKWNAQLQVIDYPKVMVDGIFNPKDDKNVKNAKVFALCFDSKNLVYFKNLYFLRLFGNDSELIDVGLSNFEVESIYFKPNQSIDGGINVYFTFMGRKNKHFLKMDIFPSEWRLSHYSCNPEDDKL